MSDLLRQIADELAVRGKKVSTRTIRRWFEKGVIRGKKTKGGHWKLHRTPFPLMKTLTSAQMFDRSKARRAALKLAAAVYTVAAKTGKGDTAYNEHMARCLAPASPRPPEARNYTLAGRSIGPLKRGSLPAGRPSKKTKRAKKKHPLIFAGIELGPLSYFRYFTLLRVRTEDSSILEDAIFKVFVCTQSLSQCEQVFGEKNMSAFRIASCDWADEVIPRKARRAELLEISNEISAKKPTPDEHRLAKLVLLKYKLSHEEMQRVGRIAALAEHDPRRARLLTDFAWKELRDKAVRKRPMRKAKREAKNDLFLTARACVLSDETPTVANIAGRLNMSRATLYRRFTSEDIKLARASAEGVAIMAPQAERKAKRMGKPPHSEDS
jgi:hypothetical protein